MTTKINNLYVKILKEEMQKEDERLKDIKVKMQKHSARVNVTVEEARLYPNIYEVNELTQEVYIKGYKKLIENKNKNLH